MEHFLELYIVLLFEVFCICILIYRKRIKILSGKCKPNYNKRIKMTVQMEVTTAQALTLQAMFEYWNTLGRMGGSRTTSFYADGDGNFHPKCKIKFSGKVPELTKELRDLSFKDKGGGDRDYDFDGVAWRLMED